jgi:hypothetical protein
MDVSIIKDDVAVKPKWTLINEHKSNKFDTLFEIYAKDKAKAKVYYHLNKSVFLNVRKVLFEFPNGDFKFVIIHKTYGISCNNKMYSSEKTFESLIYKNKKFYHYNHQFSKGFVKALNMNEVRMFLNNFGNDKVVLDYLISKFSWIRYIHEDYMFSTVNLNTVIAKKLYNQKAMLRHLYRCPYPVAKFIHVYCHSISSPSKYLKVWYEMRKRLINIENFKEEMFKHPMFNDTCRFSQMLDKTVNCSWGLKRLESEHNKWSKEVVKVILEFEPLIELKIHDVFIDFAKYSGFHMLKTNHELIAEGNAMNHCVGTYSENVNNDDCAIYRVYEHTLEVRKNNKGLYIGQYMGYSNQPAPKEIYEKVNAIIKGYVSIDYQLECDNVFEGDLPF